MNEYRVTIYNSISEKKRRINVRAWNIRDASEYMIGRLNSIAEEIIIIKKINI